MAYAESFVAPISNDYAIYNSGSLLLVAPLATTFTGEPVVHTLTLDGAIAVLDVTADLKTDNAVATFLRKGTVLHFGSNKLVVAADTNVLTGVTATAVPIEAATAIIADAATTTTWALLRAASPSDLPVSTQDQSTDLKDLNNGIQGSNLPVDQKFSPQVTLIAKTNDRAYYELIRPAGTTSKTTPLFAHIYRNGGLHAFGAAYVMNLNEPGVINEVTRPQFTLEFQAPFALPTKYTYLSTGNKAILNTVCKLSGLNVYT